MAQWMRYKQGIFRVMATLLILVSVSFSMPDNYYSIEKTFIKSPSPQAELFSFIVNDLEDTDDSSPDLISLEFIKFDFSIFTIHSTESESALSEKIVKLDPIYLIHRKLLI
ncbi:MAG TPA: hypothetical protein DGG95_18580 [Cytophagales bacterium]|jgi:hypothetical protein|nr:hypothetical protein [Cytophagales bacterium]